MLIAKSQACERYDVDRGVSWNEYRCRKIDPAEFDAMIGRDEIGRLASYQPWVVEVRRIETDGDAVTEYPWEPWQFGETAAKAIAEGIGDSSYESAESIHPEHYAAVQHSRKVRAAYSRQHDAEKRLSGLREELARYKREVNREFATKTEGKDDAGIAKVRARLLKLRAPRKGILEAEIKSAETELASANEELTELCKS